MHNSQHRARNSIGGSQVRAFKFTQTRARPLMVVFLVHVVLVYLLLLVLLLLLVATPATVLAKNIRPPFQWLANTSLKTTIKPKT